MIEFAYEPMPAVATAKAQLWELKRQLGAYYRQAELAAAADEAHVNYLNVSAAATWGEATADEATAARAAWEEARAEQEQAAALRPDMLERQIARANLRLARLESEERNANKERLRLLYRQKCQALDAALAAAVIANEELHELRRQANLTQQVSAWPYEWEELKPNEWPRAGIPCRLEVWREECRHFGLLD